MPQIHPQACVDPSAELAEDVEVGPFVIIEADVKIGKGCVLRAYSMVRRFTHMGEGNFVDSQVVLGGVPQDLSFDPGTESYLKIGEGNTFREGVTIHRARNAGEATTVGNETYWMANTHAAHNAVIEDGAILTNNAIVGEHAHLGRRVVLGGGSTVHPFCWVGERAMFQGLSASHTHVPPFCINGGQNAVAGLNRVGIKRAADISRDEARQIKEAFALLYRRGLSPRDALAQMDAQEDWGPAPKHFADFVRRVIAAEAPFGRGLCPMADRGRQGSQSDSDTED